MKIILCILFGLSLASYAAPVKVQTVGVASWYGEQHRGKLMANGKPFNPDKLTAASWFYPLGTRVKVTLRHTEDQAPRQVIVTITDRGPAWRLVDEGRIIDLGHAAFKKLAPPSKGLVPVKVEVLPENNDNATPESKTSERT